MTTDFDFRALCAELLDELEYHTDWSIAESLKAKARAALADKSADTDQVLNLAAIIREVDGGHSKGAAALAESILDHPRFRAALADEPAVPEGREPVAVIGEPSDRRPTVMEIIELSSKIEAAELGQVDFARAVLARWGNPAPLPPAEGEVVECAAELEEQKPRPDYDRVQKIATEAQIRSAAQHLAKKQHCDGDLIPAIRYAIARWGNPAPQPPSDDELLRLYGVATPCHTVHEWERELKFARAVLARWGNPAPQPPAEGEVEELVNALKGIAYWRRHNKPGGPAPAPFDIRQADRLDRAADLLRRLSPPQPVPVSERLPGPSDCAPWPKDSDASAWCWVGTDEDGGWNWEQRSAGCLAMFPDDFTHWLPAHALPIPQQ